MSGFVSEAGEFARAIKFAVPHTAGAIPMLVVDDVTASVVKRANGGFAIIRKFDDPRPEVESEERTVLGIVLEPEVIDAQNDIYSADEIRRTAWRFMEQYQQFGLMHQAIMTSILPLESYLAPVDFVIGGQKVRKGSWLLRVRVLDDAIWRDVKSGRLTGFSIGGSAIRRPDLVGDAA